jgi:alpha-beta hydrolase superfamily lysophospholipase
MEPQELTLAPTPAEPLAPWFSPERRGDVLTEQRFELNSAGDLVSGRCWRPDRAASELVLAIHELGRGKDDAAIAEAAAAWGTRGAMTAAIDLPLHGERVNAKLLPRAITAAAGATGDADAALWRSLLAQALRDLARTLDALATREPLPAVSCVAFGGGSAPIALAFASLDPRVARVAAVGPARSIALDLGARGAKALAWLARPDDWTRVG